MDRIRTGSAVLGALIAAALAPSPALANGVDDGPQAFCEWVLVSSSNVHGDQDAAMGFLGEWEWFYGAAAGPFSVYAELSGETWDWGFPSVSKANSGDGHYVIQRLQTCHEPHEDIEATGRNQFTASAWLDADEVARALGSMDVWAAKMRSDNRPPARFRCHAVGGVESTATPRDSSPDGTVSFEWEGLGASVNLFWSAGGSAEEIFDSFDSGSGGRSPETIDTLNKSALTLDLDMYDVGDACIRDSRLQLRVLATCDGDCKVVRTMINWNTYQR